MVGFLHQSQVTKLMGRYIFATESSASKNDLIFSVGDNTGDEIKNTDTEIKNSEDGWWLSYSNSRIRL